MDINLTHWINLKGAQAMDYDVKKLVDYVRTALFGQDYTEDFGHCVYTRLETQERVLRIDYKNQELFELDMYGRVRWLLEVDERIHAEILAQALVWALKVWNEKRHL